MSKVLGLDAQTSGPAAWLGYDSARTLLLLGLMVRARVVASREKHATRRRSRRRQPAGDRGHERRAAASAPSAPAEPRSPRSRRRRRGAAPHEAPPPAAAPAQAAKVLTQEPDPNEPVDLTGNTIVQGNADSYAGGFTAANGTSTRAVRAMREPDGRPQRNGAPAPAPPPARARPLAQPPPSAAREWNVPFPPEADTAQIDEAYVSSRSTCRPTARWPRVRVLSDPGNGFGRRRAAAR